MIAESLSAAMFPFGFQLAGEEARSERTRVKQSRRFMGHSAEDGRSDPRSPIDSASNRVSLANTYADSRPPDPS